MFFPCLITELCLKEGVPIAPYEQRKFPPGNSNAEMRERLRKVRGPMPAMQEHHMQKQVAVRNFLKEQHDWLQLVFQNMFDILGHVEVAVFPSWVIRTEEQEEKEEEQEEETIVKKKKVTRKQENGKKKVVTEPEVEELYDSDTEEDEAVEEMEKDEDEEDSDLEVDSEEEEHARGVILEEITRQKYAKTPPPVQQETTRTSPITSPTSSPIHSPIQNSPIHQESSPHPKSPLPSLNDPPIQSPPQTTPPPPSPRTETEQPPHTEQEIQEASRKNTKIATKEEDN